MKMADGQKTHNEIPTFISNAELKAKMEQLKSKDVKASGEKPNVNQQAKKSK